MKKTTLFAITLILIFSLSCARDKSSAIDSLKSKYTVPTDEVDKLIWSDNPRTKKSVTEEKKADTATSTSDSSKSKSDTEPLIPVDKLPKKPTIKGVTITADDVPLKKGPGDQFETLKTANKDDNFTLIRTVPGSDKKTEWYQIQNAKDEKFFVSSLYATVGTRKEKIKRSQKVTLEKIQTIFDPTPPLPKELVEAKVITLNFEQTDIADVITTFCELLKIDYLIENAVQGKVTLQTFNNIPVEDLYSVLEQILAIHNVTVVRSGNFYRFLPLKDAISKPMSIYYGDQANVPSNDRMIIQIIPLKHISVESMKKIISPLLTKNATFLDVPETNNLMLVELASNVKRVIKVIQALDIDKLSQSDIQLYKIQHADARVLVREITEVFATMGYRETLGTSLNFLPIERLNSLLVVNSFPDILPTIEFWVEKLDQPSTVGDGKVSSFVYYVQNGEAGRMAALLNSIFARAPAPLPGAQGAGTPGRPGTLGAPGAPQAFGSPVAFGAQGAGAQGTQNIPGAQGTQGLPGAQGTTPGTQGTTPGAQGTPITTPGSTPVSLANQLGVGRGSIIPGLKVSGGLDEEFDGPLTIISDKDTNALIIRTSPRNYPVILEVLKKLDLMPQQILIEVLIMDVTIDEQTQTGLQLAFASTAKNVSSTLGLNATSIPVPGQGAAANLGASATSLFSAGAGFLIQNPAKFVTMIQALATDSKVNVVSNPVLVTSNNKAATISITNEIPIVSSTLTPSSAGGQVSQTVQFRSVGVILNIDPKINKDGFINMKVSQEVSSLGATIAGQPSFNTRSLTSEVILRDNQILVMGGLMQTTVNKSNQGVPYLKDLPYVGRLFGTNSDSTDKTELMLFITPHIISNHEDAEFVTNQMRAKLANVSPQRFRAERAEVDDSLMEKPARTKKSGEKLTVEPIKPKAAKPSEQSEPESKLEDTDETVKQTEKPNEPVKAVIEKNSGSAMSSPVTPTPPASPVKITESKAADTVEPVEKPTDEAKPVETSKKRTKSIIKRAVPEEAPVPTQ